MNNLSFSSRFDLKWVTMILTIINAAFGVPLLIRLLINRATHFNPPMFTTVTVAEPIVKGAAAVYLVAFICMGVATYFYRKERKYAIVLFVIACLVAAIGFERGAFTAASYPALFPLEFSIGTNNGFRITQRNIVFSIAFIIPALMMLGRHREVTAKRVLIFVALSAGIAMLFRSFPFLIFRLLPPYF